MHFPQPFIFPRPRGTILVVGILCSDLSVLIVVQVLANQSGALHFLIIYLGLLKLVAYFSLQFEKLLELVFMQICQVIYCMHHNFSIKP